LIIKMSDYSDPNVKDDLGVENVFSKELLSQVIRNNPSLLYRTCQCPLTGNEDLNLKELDFDEDPWGEHYLSLQKFITIPLKPCSTCGAEPKFKETKLNFKGASQYAGTRVVNGLMAIHPRAVDFYNKLFPEFAKHVKEWTGDDDIGMARCYYARHNGLYDGLAVLEDLKMHGYIDRHTSLGMDYDHVMVMCTRLAKLHAMSYSYIQRHPKEFYENFKNDIVNNSWSRKQMGEACNNAFRFHWNKFWIPLVAQYPEYADILEKMKRFNSDDFWGETHAIMTQKDQPLKVFNHGDTYMANWSFKYEERDGKQVPVDGKFPDAGYFSHYTSPMVDLSYMLHGCSTKKLRDDHLDEFLQCYQENFVGQLKKMSMPTGRWTLKFFQYEYQRMRSFGLTEWTPMMAITCMPKKCRIQPYNFYTYAINVSDDLVGELMKQGKDFVRTLMQTFLDNVRDMDERGFFDEY